MSYAVVTGGSIGLGRSFSNLLADRGYNLVLVSRNLEHLALAQKEIQQKYKVKVQIYVGDLSDRTFISKFIEYSKAYDIEILINNAGFGHNDAFSLSPLDKELSMVDLNIKALQELMKYFYLLFKSQNKGRIINVSSLAGFVPGPYASTYYATKAYVNSITRSVAYEAKKEHSNVIVQALCPGPLKTYFHQTAGTNPNHYKKNPDNAARLALDSKRVIIVPGFKEKTAHVLLKLVPTALSLRVAGIGQKRKKKQLEKK